MNEESLQGGSCCLYSQPTSFIQGIMRKLKCQKTPEIYVNDVEGRSYDVHLDSFHRNEITLARGDDRIWEGNRFVVGNEFAPERCLDEERWSFHDKRQYVEHVHIPTGVTSIVMSALHDCISLQTVTIPLGVRVIREHVFNGCCSLRLVDLPDDLQSIEASAFSDCKALTSIRIPKKVTQIGDSAFSYCTSLQCVCLPKQCQTDPQREGDAFGNCHLLEDDSTRFKQDGDMIKARWLRRRFDDLPFHRACYYASSEKDFEELKKMIDELSSLECENKLLSLDDMDMTALHVLCCNFHAKHDVFAALVAKCSGALKLRDCTDKTPLDLFLACRGMLSYLADGETLSLLKVFTETLFYEKNLIECDQMKIMLTLGIGNYEYNGLPFYIMAGWSKCCSLESFYEVMLRYINKIPNNVSASESNNSSNCSNSSSAQR